MAAIGNVQLDEQIEKYMSEDVPKVDVLSFLYVNAARPEPAMMEVGVAKPSAQEHGIIKTR